MKRTFILAAVALSFHAVAAQTAINPGSMTPRRSTIFKVGGQVAAGSLVTFRFDNLGLNVDSEHQALACDSTRYICTIRNVRDDCNEKRCLHGYSITITKK